MTNSTSAPQSVHPITIKRGLARWGFKQVVFVLIVFAARFAPVGSFAGTKAWLFVGLVALIQALTALILIPRSPELLVERAQIKQGVKTWDIGLAVLMGYSPVFMALAAGFEARRAAPSETLDVLVFAAVLVAFLGTLYTLWAMVSNPFFSGIVRIQQERGHSVASAGPYQHVRHPGYAGLLLFILAAPLILGSAWAFGVAVLTVIVTFVRTALEDRTLQRELPGYADYARRVKVRLVPGIW